MKVSRRVEISPFIVMEVMRASAEREAAGEHVLHLEVGQPSTPAPGAVLAAAKQALDRDRIGYTVALGIPPLRARIARHYTDFYGVDVSPDNIVVTGGASGGVVLACLAGFDPGDRVAITAPCYPCYRNILRSLGIDVVELPGRAQDGFQPTPELLDSAGPLAGVLIASPANPTGALIDDAAMAALVAWCRERDVRLVSDEIYHGITFGGRRAVTALAYDGQSIVVNSFSKYFSMTGWRLGWLVVPDDLVRPIERLTQNLYINAPTLSQIAGVAAFDCYDEVDAHVLRYARNRDILLETLPAAGLTGLAPADGAFYVYADVSHLSPDSMQLCRRILAETGVAVTPGIDFDLERGKRTIRLSYAGATGEVAEAAQRLGDWLAGQTSA